jgi:sigma-B regulation protein RsbU (phosphoserine phosphatase)
MRIYVADDSEDARDIMAASLFAGGYTDVIFAESGLELLAGLGIDPVNFAAPEADLILLDIRMPGPDGIETCARVRADARYQHTPILMITSLDDMETLKNAFVAGANDFINKPFNRIEFHARLRCAIRYKGELDRRHARERELAPTGQKQESAASKDGIGPASFLISRAAAENHIGALKPDDCERMGVVALQIDRLDHFQSHYGAPAATQMLTRVARTLAQLPAGLGDVLSDFGYGVFVALLHRVDEAALARVAQTMRDAVHGLAVPHRGSGSQDIVTVSVGVAFDREPRTLLPAAVSAMERAAERGGDRILFA